MENHAKSLQEIHLNSLKSKAKSLIRDMEVMIKRIDAGKISSINELGEIQSRGNEIDVLCGKVVLLERLINQDL